MFSGSDNIINIILYNRQANMSLHQVSIYDMSGKFDNNIGIILNTLFNSEYTQLISSECSANLTVSRSIYPSSEGLLMAQFLSDTLFTFI